MAGAIRAIGATAFTYYHSREEFGELTSDRVNRLKDLEKENERLREAVLDLTLEKPDIRKNLPNFAGAAISDRAGARIGLIWG